MLKRTSIVSLAQAQRAALIETMFGVTTSDDYRPVAWMGRYPVDVTTMLVGMHVAAAILAAFWCNFGAGVCFALAAISTARAIWSSGAGVAAVYLRIRSFPVRRCFGLRSRCTCCSSSGEKWNVFSAGARTSRFILILLVTPAGTVDDLGTLGAMLTCRFARVALWNFCCVRHHLSARRIVAADPGQVGRTNSRCHLHFSTARLSRLERSGRCLDKHWRRVPLR